MVTDILIPIGSSMCLKEAKTMDMLLGKYKFQNSVLNIFSNKCCRYALALPHIPMCTYNMFLLNKLAVHHKHSQLFSLFQ